MSIKRTKGEAPKANSESTRRRGAIYVDSGVEGTLKITLVMGNLAENQTRAAAGALRQRDGFIRPETGYE